jgi:hypothetical protein
VHPHACRGARSPCAARVVDVTGTAILPGARLIPGQHGQRPTPARVRVRRPSGAGDVFLATSCTIEGGVVFATGRWQRDRAGTARAYAWPTRSLIEVAWL